MFHRGPTPKFQARNLCLTRHYTDNVCNTNHFGRILGRKGQDSHGVVGSASTE